MTGGDYSALTPVVPGAVTEQWGLDVRDSVVLRFASEAARDSALVGLGSGDSGLTAWIQDIKLMTTWEGTAWAPVSPYRVGGITPRTADATMTTTETLVDTFTTTILGDRRYRITWSGSYYSDAAADSVDIRLRYAAGSSVSNTSGLIKGCAYSEPAANHNLNGTFVAEKTGMLAGQKTFGVFGLRTGGSGTVHLFASSVSQVHFFIEDIGAE
jgi:hypothetical protein